MIDDIKVVRMPRREPEGVYHDDLMCFLVMVGYHYDTGIGTLLVDRNSKTNMSGAIRLFEAIDKNVKEIIVLAGPRKDIIYGKLNDRWVVLDDVG